MAKIYDKSFHFQVKREIEDLLEQIQALETKEEISDVVEALKELSKSIPRDYRPTKSASNRSVVRRVMAGTSWGPFAGDEREADKDGNYMSVQNMKDIHTISGQLSQTIQAGDDMEDWVEDKISAARQILSDLERFYNKGWASKEASNVPDTLLVYATVDELGFDLKVQVSAMGFMNTPKRPVIATTTVSVRSGVDIADIVVKALQQKGIDPYDKTVAFSLDDHYLNNQRDFGVAGTRDFDRYFSQNY